MRTIAFAVMLSVASVGLCQTPVKEPDILQSLLVEVHQLRQDIEAMTVASQRLEDARNKRSGAEGNRQHTATEIQRLENVLASGAPPENDAKAIQSRLTEVKSALDAQTAEVQTCQAAEADASSQLRNDQAKLVEVQDRIERLDKSLEKLSAAGK